MKCEATGNECVIGCESFYGKSCQPNDLLQQKGRVRHYEETNNQPLRCAHGVLLHKVCPNCEEDRASRASAPADNINPTHYKTGKVEVIDFIREQLGDEGFVAYCRGNAIKYHARAGKKGIAPSAEDLAKAGWYSAMAAHVGDPSKYADPRQRPTI